MNEPTSRERLWELLADRALGMLSPADEAELAALLAKHPEVDPLSLDRAAAMVYQGDPNPAGDPMPASVAGRILADAPNHPPFGATVPHRRSWTRTVAPWLGWAIAACMGAILIAPPFLPAPTAERRFAELTARDGTKRYPAAAPDAKANPAVTGEVVWNAEAQRGFVRLRGLPKNDPARRQYQLWIFDATRGPAADPPVDGGVFDAGDGETLVPIDAKLRVGDPTLFAVTEERAGGVVVSDRQRIVLVAAP